MDKTEWQLFLEDVDEALRDDKCYQQQKSNFLKPAENCINDLFNKAKQTANSKNEFINILLGNSPKIKQNNALLYSNKVDKHGIKGYEKIENIFDNSYLNHVKIMNEKINEQYVIERSGIYKTYIKYAKRHMVYRLLSGFYICSDISKSKTNCYVFMFPLAFLDVKK